MYIPDQRCYQIRSELLMTVDELQRKYQNQFHPTIEIDDNTNTVIVKTRTRDKVNDIQEYLIEHVEIKIKKTEVIYTTYILEISNNKLCD